MRISGNEEAHIVGQTLHLSLKEEEEVRKEEDGEEVYHRPIRI